jgi:hypothetical protein
MNDQIKILDTIIASIKNNPSQFHYRVEISTIGMQGTAINGGIGVMGIANAPGSVGVVGSASGSSTTARIINEGANSEIEKNQQEVLKILNELKMEAQKESPDKNTLSKILEKAISFVPDAIIAVLRLSMGI